MPASRGKKLDEFDVLILRSIFQGKGFKEIAYENGRHLRAIDWRMARIKKEFGAKSLVHLLVILIVQKPRMFKKLIKENI